MRLPKQNELVFVSWVDIQSGDGWVDPGSELGVAECFTVGVVTSVSSRVVTLAACVGIGEQLEHAEVNLRMSIPVGCITSWAPLIKGKVVK